MPIVSLIVVLIVIGILLFCTNTYIPMDGKIKQLINVVVIVCVVVWLLQVFGLFNMHLGNVPHFR